MARLGDVFPLIRNGASIKQTDGAAGYPITRIETIANREIDRSKFGYADIEDVEKYQDYLLQDGDILMSHINSEKHLGKVALYHAANEEKIIHGMNLLMLRANRNLIRSDYATYFLNSEAFLRQIPNITKKSVNQASFTVTALKELTIPVPELSEQKEISKNLDKISILISLRKQQLAKLDELAKARFVELIRSNATRYVKLKDVVEEGRIITYGIVKPGEHTEGGVPIIKVKDFPNGTILMNDMLLASPEIESKYERSRVKEGDLLFSIRGSVGRTAFVPKELTDANITQDTARLSISENFASKYVRAALEYDSVQYDINQYVRGVAVRGINLADLREIEIPIVDFNLQNQFAAFVEQVDKSKLAIQQSLDKLETLKKSLMQKYFG